MNHLDSGFNSDFDSGPAHTLDPIDIRTAAPDRELASRFLGCDSSREWVDESSGLRGEGSNFGSGPRLAELRDGRLALPGLDPRLESRLLQLHRRLAAAVVADRPRPIECAALPGADRLMAVVEREWCDLRDGFRRDPDVSGWTDVLEDRTREIFVEWCFRLLFDLSHGTLQRLEDSDGCRPDFREVWISAEPMLLAADLAESLAGRMPDRHIDPLLAVRRVPA